MGRINVSFILSIAWLLLVGCNRFQKAKATIHLRGYENAQPQIVYLPESVSQVSGIAYYPKDTSVFCVDDNTGTLFKVSLTHRNRLQRWPFSRLSDHEGLVLHEKTFYAMKSDGTIEAIQFKQGGQRKVKVFRSNTTIKQREFESLVYDPRRRLFLLACKDCEDDGGDKTSVWGVDFTRKEMLPEPVFVINHPEIEKRVGKFSKFKPSDAAIHPITGDFYFVSAINHLMIVTDSNGKVKEATALDHVLFKQPEGLAFSPKGTLLISNEEAEVGPATILIYSYKPIKP